MARNKKRPLFTLLCACCNGESYVRQFWKSVVDQTYRPLEVVFIDDKSTDRSVKFLKKFAAKSNDPEISLELVQHKRKLYYGGALKHGLLFAHGKYMGTLDVDDYLMPHAVEHVVKLYQEYRDVGYIYTQFINCNCDLTPHRIGFSDAPTKKESILSMGTKHRKHVYSHFRTFSNRIPHLLDIFPKRGKYAVDQFMGMMLEERAVGMFTNRVCYMYRAGCDGTISAQFGSQRRQYWYKLMNQFAERRNTKKIRPIPILTDPTDWSDENLHPNR